MTKYERHMLQAMALIMQLIAFSLPIKAYDLFSKRIEHWKKLVSES